MKKIVLLLFSVLLFSCDASRTKKRIVLIQQTNFSQHDLFASGYLQKLKESETPYRIKILPYDEDLDTLEKINKRIKRNRADVIVDCTGQIHPLAHENIPILKQSRINPIHIFFDLENENENRLEDPKAFLYFLLKLVPDVKKIGLLYDENNEIQRAKKKCLQEMLNDYSIECIEYEKNNSLSYDSINNCDVLLTLFLTVLETTLASHCMDHKIPLLAMENESVACGAFAATYVDYEKLGKHAAKLTIDYLYPKAEKTKEEMNVSEFYSYSYNLETAKRIGRFIPKSLLETADQIHGYQELLYP